MVTGKPYLQLETGMHTAPIRRIAMDARERYLVTGSEDKTARVWELSTGKLLQVLRPPLGDADEGWLYAVAISPDGNEVAVGGFTGRVRLRTSSARIWLSWQPSPIQLSRLQRLSGVTYSDWRVADSRNDLAYKEMEHGLCGLNG